MPRCQQKWCVCAGSADAPDAAIGLLAANVAMYRGKLAPTRSSRIDHRRVPASVERLVWPLQEYKIMDRSAGTLLISEHAILAVESLLLLSLI